MYITVCVQFMVILFNCEYVYKKCNNNSLIVLIIFVSPLHSLSLLDITCNNIIIIKNKKIYKYFFIELWKLFSKLLSIYTNAVGIVLMNIVSYCSHIQIIQCMISDIISFNIIHTIIIKILLVAIATCTVQYYYNKYTLRLQILTGTKFSVFCPPKLAGMF